MLQNGLTVLKKNKIAILCFVFLFNIESVFSKVINLGPGEIGGSQTICAGTIPNPLTSVHPANAGIPPYIYQWQSSTTGLFGVYSDIVGANGLTYSPGVLNQTTHFRRKVSTLDDPAVFTDPVTITVTPASTAGTINGDAFFCNGPNSTTLTLSGNVGNIVEWQSATNSGFTGTVTSIPGTANLTTYTAVNLTASTFFRVIVKNGTCPPDTSNPKGLTLLTPFAVAGTISGPSSACFNSSNSTTLTLSGTSGTILKWESSPSSDFTSSVQSIANTTSTLNINNLTTTMYYRAIVSNGPTDCRDTSAIKTITIDQNPIAGTLTGSDSICVSAIASSNILTLTSYTGTILKWQSSLTSDFSSQVTDIVNTSDTYTANGITQTTYFRVIVSNGVCNNDTSSIAHIFVTPPSVGGNVTGNNPFNPNVVVCTGTNSSMLVLSGHTGSIVKWQSSLTSDFSGTINDIINTTSSLTVTNLSTTTYYRVVVKSGDCDEAFSSIRVITVNPTSDAGNLSSDTVCTGLNSSILRLSNYIGVINKWQSSTSNDFTSGVVDIANTTDSLVITNTSATIYFRVIVKSGVCPADTSSIGHIFINSPSIAGTLNGGDTVCAGINNTTLILSGTTGDIIKWQSASSLNFISNIIDINTTSSTLIVNNINATTYYRAVVQNGLCPQDTSNVDSIIVNNTSVAGTLIGSDSICVTAIPSSNLLKLTSYNGSIIKWQSSLTPDFSSQVTDILNTIDTYTANGITQTTYYRAIVSNGVCKPDTSSIAHIFVTPPSVGGTVTGNNPFNPNVIVCAGINSSTLVLSGHTGTIIKWQSSLTSDFSGAIIDITNTASSLLVTNLTTTTYYRVIVKSGECDSAISSIRVITVNPTTNAGDLSSDTVCTGLNSSIIRLSNYIGAITKWQSSSSSDFTSGVIDIANATDSLLVTNTNATIYYRVIVKSGVCPADTSSIGHIFINSPSIAGTLNGGDTVCAGVNSTTLVLSGTTGVILKWQSSTTSNFSSNIIDINSVNDSLIISNLNTTTYYRIIVQNGVCPADTSNIDSIIVNSPNIAGTLIGGAAVCVGINSTTLVLTVTSGSIIQWQSASNSSFTSNVVNISTPNDSLIINNLNSTTYYRVIVQNGVCPADTSNIDSIIVNSPSIAGTLIGGATVCAGINSTTLVLTGTNGSIIQWQSASNSSFTSNVVNISTPNDSLIINNLNNTTYYRVIVQNGVCDPDTSNIDSIIVNTPSIAGLLSGSDTVCVGINSTTLVLSSTIGSILKWQSSTTSNFSSNVVDINSTNDSLILNNLNSTTYYRVIVQNGVCPADTSNVVLIKIVSSTFSNVIYSPSPDTFYSSGNPDSILGSTQSIDSAFFFYQWQQSISNDSTIFIDIIGANSFFYDPPILNQSTWYRRILYSFICSINDTSNIVKITILPIVSNPTPILGASLSVDKPTAIMPGSYHIDYTITLKNMGNVNLENIRLKEDYSAVFHSPSTFSVVNIVADNGLTVNPNFDGTSVIQLLDSTNSVLLVGESKLIKVRLLVNPNLPDVTYYNQVFVYADMLNGSFSVIDSSVKGDNPDPNNNGIPDEQSLTDVSISIFVPSGYSPNGDGKNDEFIIVGIENFPNNRLEIYNRWGNKVFEQAPYDNTWKGTVKNTDGFIIGEGLLPSGTYFYLLDFGIPGVKQLTGYIVIRK